MKTIWNNITWFFRKLKRVWDFLPHIWRGYDFDYRYSIDLFIYQLERQAKFFESNRAYSSTRLRDAERIRTAVRLLRKVYDDEYAMEYQNELIELYGNNVLDVHFIPIAGTTHMTMQWEYERWENADEVHRIKSQLVKEANEKQKRAEDLVWKYIKYYIRYWWD
jgi:hypothetical protein